RSGRACRTWPHPAPQTRGNPGVFRPRRCFQWARRSHQRPPRTFARHRPGIPQLHQLRTALPHPLRTTRRTHQRTLKPEEPDILAFMDENGNEPRLRLRDLITTYTEYQLERSEDVAAHSLLM